MTKCCALRAKFARKNGTVAIINAIINATRLHVLIRRLMNVYRDNAIGRSKTGMAGDTGGHASRLFADRTGRTRGKLGNNRS